MGFEHCTAAEKVQIESEYFFKQIESDINSGRNEDEMKELNNYLKKEFKNIKLSTEKKFNLIKEKQDKIDNIINDNNKEITNIGKKISIC